MPLRFFKKLCQKLQHPFRKKMKVGQGSVCLFCRENRGLYYPYSTLIDKLYNKLFY